MKIAADLQAPESGAASDLPGEQGQGKFGALRIYYQWSRHSDLTLNQQRAPHTLLQAISAATSITYTCPFLHRTYHCTCDSLRASRQNCHWQQSA